MSFSLMGVSQAALICNDDTVKKLLLQEEGVDVMNRETAHER